jgi:hypothetical protein
MLSNRSAAQYWGDFCKEALMAAIYSDLEGKSVFSALSSSSHPRRRAHAPISNTSWRADGYDPGSARLILQPTRFGIAESVSAAVIPSARRKGPFVANGRFRRSGPHFKDAARHSAGQLQRISGNHRIRGDAIACRGLL